MSAFALASTGGGGASDEIKSISDDFKLLTISPEEARLRGEVDTQFNVENRNTLVDLVKTSMPKAALSVEGVDGGAGIASLVLTSRALTAAYEFSNFPFNPKDTPVNQLDNDIDQLLGELTGMKRAEKEEGYKNFKASDAKVSGKLTTAYGYTAGARTPPSSSPAFLWNSVHDLDIEMASYTIRDYDQAYNADDSMDWLVAACALYLMARAATSPSGVVSADPIAILNAATGVSNRDWSVPQREVISIAESLSTADVIVFPSTDNVPEDMRLFVQIQKVYSDITNKKDMLLISLARLKRLSMKVMPFMVQLTQDTWNEAYRRFITPMEQRLAPGFIAWLSNATTTQLADLDWVRKKITSASGVSAGVMVLCICVYLDSKYSTGMPLNTKAQFRNTIQQMQLPLVRSYYFMKS